MISLHSTSVLLIVVAVFWFDNQVKADDKFGRINPSLLFDLFNKYNVKDDNPLRLLEQVDQYRHVENPFRVSSNRIAKDFDGFANLDEDRNDMLDDDQSDRVNNPELSFNGPSNNDNQFISHGIRDQEALEHSALWRHQMMQGGAGEGQQHLKPDGSIKNIQVVKTDAMLPAYCTPPNPCPPGYTEEDGCLASFENTASFSRQYQSMQDCMCDTEHMFNCDSNNNANSNDNSNNANDNSARHTNQETPASRYSYLSDQANDQVVETPEARQEEEERQLNTIARSLANQPIDSEVAEQLIDTLLDHKVVAKKFAVPKPISPYLQGEKLPIVAKKSPGMQ